MGLVKKGRLGSHYAPYKFGYPLFPHKVVVSLCITCYKKLCEASGDVKKQAEIVRKYAK